MFQSLARSSQEFERVLMAWNRILSSIEQWHHRASDSPVIWFPFLFLKPDREQKIEKMRLVVMAVFFSLYFNLGYLIKVYFIDGSIEVGVLIRSQLWFFLFFFSWFSIVTRPLWNRRAIRLLNHRRDRDETS